MTGQHKELTNYRGVHRGPRELNVPLVSLVWVTIVALIISMVFALFLEMNGSGEVTRQPSPSPQAPLMERGTT